MTYKTFKVRLHPNDKQNTRMFQYAGASRFAYNWAVAELKSGWISESDLRKKFTAFKKQPENAWLNTISNDVMKQAIKDACDAWKRYWKHLGNPPRFKSRRNSKPSFYQDTVKIKFTDTHVWIEKLSGSRKSNRMRLNWIKLAEKARIPTDAKYFNPRFTFDGLYWNISVSIAISDRDVSSSQKSDGIGVDLGIKNLAVCSDGVIYPNLNKSDYIRKLKRRERHQQRSISRKYKTNNPGLIKFDNKTKKGVRYRRSRNTQKAVKRHLKTSRRIVNIMQAYILSVVKEIIGKNPEFIVLEDLNVKGMMKNRHLSKAIAGQRFGLFRRIMTEEARKLGIKLVIANKWFPSSKTCHVCKTIKQDLKLSDRVYRCPVCGLNIDRDLNAALNLRDYGYTA